ncbi:hypothetical protein SBV1_370084 [Verrucomicrobia bacterium]|nr:hypothetical protein SBV1_370084 [Verrucomicrobiota bacterium]
MIKKSRRSSPGSWNRPLAQRLARKVKYNRCVVIQKALLARVAFNPQANYGGGSKTGASVSITLPRLWFPVGQALPNASTNGHAPNFGCAVHQYVSPLLRAILQSRRATLMPRTSRQP